MHSKNGEGLVTIVTVTYNAEDLLERTLHSVINQNYKNIEYIVIDGASTDKTVELIKKYEKQMDHWVSEPDEGIYFAMNKAIKKATGEWIIFMNAGDVFFDDETVSYVIQHKDGKADLVYGNCKIDTKIVKPHDIFGYNNIAVICHQTLFVKTKLIKESPFDTRYKVSADHDFILKMYKSNKHFHYLDRVIANFLPDGLSDIQIFRLRIEALSILFANNVPENDILRSRWYVNFSKDILREKSDQQSILQEAIQKLTHYSIWKHPLKKYKSYKAMLSTYRKIIDSEKGNKVEK